LTAAAIVDDDDAETDFLAEVAVSFELWMNGVGDAFSIEHYKTNFLVEKDGFILAVDCGDSYRRALHDNGWRIDGEQLDVDRIDALVLTHLHGDHVNGLEMALAFRRYSRGGSWDIYTHPEAADQLWGERLGVSLGQSWDGEEYQQNEASDFYNLHTVALGGSVDIGPFEVSTRRTTHHITTMAVRISDGESTLGYSCDTEFDPTLVEWLADADTIIHETSYGPAHTPLFKLMELPPDVREKMLVVHYPDEIEPVPELTFAEQGRTYHVGE
jgi:ribonuclease BN (tRNA processing enzyme)